jgi:hypothetical protein
MTFALTEVYATKSHDDQIMMLTTRITLFIVPCLCIPSPLEDTRYTITKLARMRNKLTAFEGEEQARDLLVNVGC